jgi:class 3 adenylate cyclase
MEAERRQVTVLFADMVGITSFSERSGGASGVHAYAKPVEADGRGSA